MPVPPPRPCVRLALVWLCWASLALACGDAHWATTSWPSDRPGTPRQPLLEAPELGLAVQATTIAYEPDAVVVSVTLTNAGDARVAVERAAILLAWDELEYPPDDPGEWIELAPGASVELRLRYHLGRPLTGPGSQLVFRSLTRDGLVVVDLPRLELPAMPL